MLEFFGEAAVVLGLGAIVRSFSTTPANWTNPGDAT
jgi:hypothetical protein